MAIDQKNVVLLPRATVNGYHDHNFLTIHERLTDHLANPPADAPRERLWRVRADQVVLAQGAIEKPLVFDGNDRPGVMLSGAAQTLISTRLQVERTKASAISGRLTSCSSSAWICSRSSAICSRTSMGAV